MPGAAELPPKKLPAPGRAPAARGGRAALAPACAAPEFGLSLRTPGCPGRRGAAGGRDVASTCLRWAQLAGESGETFPTRFPALRGGGGEERGSRMTWSCARGESDPDSQESAPLSVLIPPLRRGGLGERLGYSLAGGARRHRRGTVRDELMRGRGNLLGRQKRRRCSFSGLSAFSRLFPQNPVSLRRAAPRVGSNNAAREGLRISAGLEAIYIPSPSPVGRWQHTVMC